MTNEELATHLLEEQYKIVGLSIEQVKEMTWEEFMNYTITTEQYQEWHKQSVDLIRKKKRWNKAMAEKEVRWLDFQHGLKLKL